MTPTEFLTSVYARLLKSGISMGEADGTDVVRYLDVLAYELENAQEDAPEAPTAMGGEVIELRRGTIDQVF